MIFLPVMRMPCSICVLGLFCVLAGRLAAAEPPKIEVRATRDHVYIGEAFVLEIRVSGVSDAPEPDLSQIRDCTTRFLGSQSENSRKIMFINGRMQSEEHKGRLFAYEITPLKGGEFHAGPVSAAIGGQTLVSEGVRLSVTAIESQEWVEIDISASRSEVLPDEQFELAFRLRLKALPPPYDGIDPLFRNKAPQLKAAFFEPAQIPGLKGPDIRELLVARLVRDQNQPGWHINDYSLDTDAFDFGAFGFPSPFRESRKALFMFDRGSVIKDGRKYWQYEFRVSYLPQEEGSYVFGPAEFKGPVAVAVNAEGQGEARDVFAIGPACTVRVVPPPEQGRPDSYIGTIGSNLAAKALLDTRECKVGDPLQLTLLLSGDVRLDRIVPPKLGADTNLTRNFSVYDDNAQALKTEGGKQYTYTLRPLREGMLTIPPVEASYFNTSERNYATVRTEPLKVLVSPSTEVTAAQVVGGRTNEPPPGGPDAALLAPAPLRTGPEGAASAPLWPDLRLLSLLLAAGPALYAASRFAVFLARRRRERAAAARAAGALVRAVAELRRSCRESPAMSDQAICTVFREYLAARLNAPAAAITPGDAGKMLAAAQADPAAASDFCAAFDRVFSAGYSSGIKADRMPVEQAIGVLEALEAGWKEGSRA